MTARGRLIVFEGGEGSGKSTQAELLAQAIDADLTREPGGTRLGEAVRRLLLDPGTGHVDPRAELMLMLAARAQHVSERIRPTLEKGRDVVCDRFSGSTIAYQAFGRGLDQAAVESADALARHDLSPDLVVLLRLPIGQAAERRSSPRDRIEGEDEQFFRRVEEAYLTLAARHAASWEVVDASGTPDEVHRRVLEVVQHHFASEVGV